MDELKQLGVTLVDVSQVDRGVYASRLTSSQVLRCQQPLEVLCPREGQADQGISVSDL